MVRVGVIGCGYWGPNLVRTLRQIEGAELVCVADARAGRREFIQKRFPCTSTASSPEGIISARDIDAVFIATPPETHCELAIAAMKAGKHVFVEKPMATRASDAERMLTVARELQRTLAVGHLFLYHPAITTIRELLKQGQCGDVFFVTSTRANPGPPNAVVDVLWDLAPHDLSMVLDVIGEFPDEVSAQGASFVNSRLTEAAFVNLKFPSGRMAQVNVNWLTSNKTRRLEIVCSAKTVVYDDMQPVQKVQVFDTGSDNRKSAKDSDTLDLSYGPGSIWIPAIPHCEPLKVECEDFLSCIQSGREPISSGQRALEVVRILESAAGAICRSRSMAVTHRATK